MLSVKEYCTSHKPTAQFIPHDGYVVYIHGFEFCDSDKECVYISEHYGTTIKYRKLQIRINENGRYFKLDNTSFYIDKFSIIGG